MLAVLVVWLLCQPPIVTLQQPAQQPQHQRGEEKNRPAGIEHPTREPPPATSEVHTPSNEPEAPDQSDRQGHESSTELGLVIPTWALVLVTAILAFFTYRLWNATKTLSEDAQRAAERQASEVRESLDIGRQTIETMERNAHQELRAYVVVHTGNFRPQNSGRGRWLEWEPRIINTGKTPAHNVVIVARAAVMPHPLPPELDLTLTVGPSSSRWTLGAGQWSHARRWLDRMLTDTEMQQVMNLQGSAVYIYGRVTYDDVFGVEHYTHFCQFAIWGSEGFAVEGNMIERHNDSD